MANLSTFSVTLGATDYPVKYAGLLAYIEPFLTNLETFSFSGGNVGIGTSSPGEKLAIWEGNIYALRAGGAKLRLADQNNEVSIESLPVGVASEMVFKNNTVERMRLDASGNLGLGVTPSAWASGAKALQFDSYSALFESVVGRTSLAFNARESSSGSYNYLQAEAASMYQQVSGKHEWYTAPSGTAGNAISFTEAMTLDASGRLMVGTTMPSGTGITIGNGGYMFARSADNGSVASIGADNGGATYISSYKGTGGTLVFVTANTSGNNTERMRLDSAGNLGIGAITPGEKLDVSGAVSTYVQVRSSNAGTGSGYFTNNATRSWLIGAGAHSGSSNLEFRDVTGSTTRMTLDTSSNLLIGTTTANARLTVSGSVSWTTGASFAGAAGNAAWATGFGSQAINASIQASDSIAGANIYAISDVRLKSNIKPIPSGLAFVKEVSAVQFTWNESGIEDTGFIAQDLLKKGFGHLVSAIPDGSMQELVHDDGNVSPAGSRFVVKYDSVVPILCKAIQEQQALIENLLARVAALEEP
jgi:hypothetical protein